LYYFANGTLATARIEQVDQESGMVNYAFEDEGVGRRGLDTVVPATGPEWDAGMLIQVLYIPGGDGLSIVASIPSNRGGNTRS
jgi:hypothetical protein